MIFRSLQGKLLINFPSKQYNRIIGTFCVCIYKDGNKCFAVNNSRFPDPQDEVLSIFAEPAITRGGRPSCRLTERVEMQRFSKGQSRRF
jgi:hypothetical protein